MSIAITKNLAFEGDSFILNELKNIILLYGADVFIETGTNTGKTTLGVSKLFKKIYTIESNYDLYKNFSDNLKDDNNIISLFGSSEKIILDILKTEKENIIFFLDAHWNLYCPLLDELKAIRDSNVKNSSILIHDFYVPESDLGYMQLPSETSVDGGPRLDINYVKNLLDEIYGGSDKYDYYYNKESDGNPRTGVLFVVPKPI